MSQQRAAMRERQVRDHFRDRGWLAFRAPASLGCADVIALKDGERPRLVEVKSTAAGPFHSFGPHDRHRLTASASVAGADPCLAWWPPRGELRFLEPEEWPE